MTKLAQIDTSSGDSYAKKLVGPSTGYTVTAEVRVPAATYGAFSSTADLLGVGDEVGGADGIWMQTGPDLFTTDQSIGTSPVGAAADTWYTAKAILTHLTGNDWTVEWQIDGVDVFAPYTATLANDDTQQLEVRTAGFFANGASGELYLFRNVEVRDVASTLIFSDDFSSGDFSNWDSVVGSGATVIDDATGPPPSPPQAAPTFTVENRAHDGTLISTVAPVSGSLKWTYRIAQSGGPGDAEWAVALSDPSLTDPDQFAPYRTDWQIVMHFPDETDEPLIAGIMTPVNTGSEASGVFGEVRCSGKDWLHWLEQPWPFDYAGIVADVAANQLANEAGLYKRWVTATQETIVGDLLAALDGNVDAVVFTPSFEGTGWSLTMNKEIGFGDNTSILAEILSVAELGAIGGDTYGFDIWVDPDKTVHLVAPRKTPPSAVTPVYILDDSSIIAPPLDWTNNGPLETDTVVFGQTANNTSRIGYTVYAASRSTYRQWTQFRQVDLAASATIAAAADAIGTQDRFPQKDLKVTIRPDLLDPSDPRAGFRNLLGQALAINYAVSPYHTIDADFWILEQAFYSPDGCNWVCDLTLQQIYAPSDTPDP